MKEENRKVPRRIAQTVLNSLKGGVVPRVGLPYITVGRKSEIEALLHDVDILEEGGASFRFIVGRYGSGKSFLIQTIRNYVMDRGFIVADADLSPERRLQGTRGQGLATYRELISNLSTKTKPEGGALTLVLDRWISGVQSQALQETGLEPGSPALTQAVDQKIVAVTSAVSELVHGFEFAKLLSLYYHAYVEGEEEKKQQVARWFRGEYATKRYRSNVMNWGMVPFQMEEEPCFEVGDYIYVPGVRKALDGDLKDIKAYVLGKEGSSIRTLDLYIADMTAEEREIVKAGCLINYNRGRH